MKLGLIGEKLGHSLSPEIHQKIFEKLGIRGTYNLLPIARMNLKDTVETLLESMDGFNVTIPYKTDIMPFLDEISPEARTIGAVNTVAVHDGKRYGYNTDYDGFARTLDKIAADVKGEKVFVMGHGGASRAVVQCLHDRGAGTILIVSRCPEAVDESFQEFAEKRDCLIIDYSILNQEDGYLLVNATPVGMYPKAGFSPVPAEVAERFDKVIDLIYNPSETKLLSDAMNADKSNGLYMLVMQAVRAEEIWLGHDIPEFVAMEIVEEMKQLQEERVEAERAKEKKAGL